MKYTEDRFTEEEKLAIDSLAKIVCYFFDISVEDVRGKSRLRQFTDARKIIASYAYHNIPVKNVNYSKGSGTTSLASWYLDVDHTSIVYCVEECDALIQSNSNFATIYDAIIDAINIKDVDGVTVADKIFIKTWEMVREDIDEPNHIKYDLVPPSVLTNIRNLYKKGYSEITIGNRCGTTHSFIKHVVNKEGLMRDKQRSIVDTANKMMVKHAIKFRHSTVIDY